MVQVTLISKVTRAVSVMRSNERVYCGVSGGTCITLQRLIQTETPASWATPEGYDKLMEERHGKEIEKWRKEYEASL